MALSKVIMEHIEILSSGSLHILGTSPDIPVYFGIIDDHIVAIAEEEVMGCHYNCIIDRRVLIVGDVVLIRIVINGGTREGFYEFLQGALKVFSHRDNFRESEYGCLISHVEARNSLGYPARLFSKLFDRIIIWSHPLGEEINQLYQQYRNGCYEFEEECEECEECEWEASADDNCECCGWRIACGSCLICSSCISDFNKSCVEDFWGQVMYLANSMYDVRQRIITMLLISRHCDSSLSGVPKEIFGIIGAMLTSEVSPLVC